jgi:hypothetical protein
MEESNNTIPYPLIPYHEGKHTKISYLKDLKVGIVEALDEYIPMNEFLETFDKVGELVKKEGLIKLIFDKRKLRVFHQPSMEWYFTIWKEEMYHYGLKTHRKLLPQDKDFRESVKIGRLKIKNDHPNIKAHLMDIQYVRNIEEAILK